jgi:hypothetical protein
LPFAMMGPELARARFFGSITGVYHTSSPVWTSTA